MLTGVHPLRLGILGDGNVIGDDSPFLAEALTAAGYQTAAFVDSESGGFLGRNRGFDRGFETYAEAPFPPPGRYRYDARATVRAADAWLARRDPARPFFLFLHTKSVHTTPEDGDKRTGLPYEKPPRYLRRFLPGSEPRFPWREDERTRGVLLLRKINSRIVEGSAPAPPLPQDQVRELIALYDAGIYYVDEQVRRLQEVLRERGVFSGTVLILTSDHGEAFLEHRFLLHRELYEPLIRVPLLVHDPRDPRHRRVRATVHLEDIPATVLRLAGVSDGRPRDGRPLPETDAGAPARATFAYYSFGPGEGYEAYALRDGRYKLIRHKVGTADFTTELYDLDRDPGESSPLRGDPREPALLAEIESRLRGAGRAGRLELSPETLEELRALGYVQ
jgi:arylsulfatase A-like enzyme